MLSLGWVLVAGIGGAVLKDDYEVRKHVYTGGSYKKEVFEYSLLRNADPFTRFERITKLTGPLAGTTPPRLVYCTFWPINTEPGDARSPEPSEPDRGAFHVGRPSPHTGSDASNRRIVPAPPPLEARICR